MILQITAGFILGIMALGYAARRKKRFLETPLPLKLHRKQHHGNRLVSLIFQSANQKPLPAWTPGSHLIVNMDAPSGKYRRAYSIVSGDNTYWEILVATHEQGRVSNQLHALSIGETIYAQPPRGRFFKLQKNNTTKVCLIGGGAGIAPLIPMAHQALSQNKEVILIHSARYKEELLKHEELQALASNNPSFTYKPNVTSQAPNAQTRRIDQNTLHEWGLNQFNGDVYLCGSSEFVDALQKHLLQLGGTGKFFKEAFTTSNHHNKATIQVGTLRFEQGHNGTLLAACEENGILPFAECRTGHCLNCRTTLHSGEVRYLTSPKKQKILKPNEILPCVCVPDGNIVLSSSNYQ